MWNWVADCSRDGHQTLVTYDRWQWIAVYVRSLAASMTTTGDSDDWSQHITPCCYRRPVVPTTIPNPNTKVDPNPTQWSFYIRRQFINNQLMNGVTIDPAAVRITVQLLVRQPEKQHVGYCSGCSKYSSRHISGCRSGLFHAVNSGWCVCCICCQKIQLSQVR